MYTIEQIEDILINAIREKKVDTIREIFQEYNIVNLAEIFEKLDTNEAIFTFRILPKDISGQLFSYLPANIQQRLVEILSSHDVSEIMNNMFNDDIVEFLEEMPANVIKKILSSMNDKDRKEINTLLSYEDFTAGAMMSSEFMELHSKETVENAIKLIKQQANLVETINVCYVIDSKRNYLGVVHLRDIIVAKENEIIENLVTEEDIFVHTSTDQEEVARILKHYDLTSLPVLNNENRLIGIITADDVIDVLVEEATEDIHKIGGVNHVEGSYLNTNILEMVKSRISWLLILMISGSFTGYILQTFEDKLSAVAVLAASVPVIMSTSGNAGSQSSSTVIRAITVEKLTLKKNLFDIIKKELLVSLQCGLVIFIVNILRLLLLSPEGMNIQIAIVVSLAIIVSLTLANIVGGILPLISESLNTDPASMASPVITTLVDAVSLLVYFSLATSILKI
ncbi:magnesium transporter [Pseudostreptobacillus hongkongensis]|uniref:magnesium transporter n=1 Tax=Pseudostreptobacillus hongkongensis TaxID=1162717 RepID=UPI0008303C85|nr:magnesium transporter [Pseudostreptobacillus hongkongensis]